jgi:hypothetical protein
LTSLGCRNLTEHRHTVTITDIISVPLVVKRNRVRFEVFTAVTKKIALFWDIKPQFILHRKHITSLLQSPVGYVRFEAFTAVTMKNAVFWDVTPCLL